MIDVARSNADNGPAPAFFVVGTAVTGGNGVVTGAAMMVVAGVAGKVSIVV